MALKASLMIIFIAGVCFCSIATANYAGRDWKNGAGNSLQNYNDSPQRRLVPSFIRSYDRNSNAPYSSAESARFRVQQFAYQRKPAHGTYGSHEAGTPNSAFYSTDPGYGIFEAEEALSASLDKSAALAVDRFGKKPFKVEESESAEEGLYKYSALPSYQNLRSNVYSKLHDSYENEYRKKYPLNFKANKKYSTEEESDEIELIYPLPKYYKMKEKIRNVSKEVQNKKKSSEEKASDYVKLPIYEKPSKSKIVSSYDKLSNYEKSLSSKKSLDSEKNQSHTSKEAGEKEERSKNEEEKRSSKKSSLLENETPKPSHSDFLTQKKDEQNPKIKSKDDILQSSVTSEMKAATEILATSTSELLKEILFSTNAFPEPGPEQRCPDKAMLRICSAFYGCHGVEYIDFCWSEKDSASLVFDKATQKCIKPAGSSQCKQETICADKSASNWTLLGGNCSKIAYDCSNEQAEPTVCGEEHYVINPFSKPSCVHYSKVPACVDLFGKLNQTTLKKTLH